MDLYRKTRIADVDFYTNKGKANGVKDALKAQISPEQYMIAKYDRYKHKDGYLKPYMHYALVTTEQLEKILEQDRNQCEVLIEGRSFYRAFFDVEIEGKGVKDPLNDVKEKILSVFPDALMNISGSHKVYDDGREKFSYHVILGNYHAECIDDFAGLKAFCLCNKEHGFDESVYRVDGLLKFMGQSKGDGRVQAYISGSEDVLDHTVMQKPESKKASQHIVEVAPLLEYLEKSIAKGKKRAFKEHKKDPKAKKIKLGNVDIFPKMSLPTLADLDVYSDEPLTLLQHLPNRPRYHEHQLSHKTCTRIARWCKYVGISWNDFWEWNKQKDDSQKRQQKYRRYWCNIDLVKYPVSSKLVSSYLCCYVYDKDILKTHPVRQMIASYNTEFNHKTESRHLSVEDHEKAGDSKAVVMHVPLGGAKSHSSMKWLKEFIKKYPRASILWLTCRVALAKDQRGRIQDLTGYSWWQFYDDLTGSQKRNPDREQEQYFVCSIQSSHYLTRLYDVIVIDECETLLKSFDPENKCVRDMPRTWDIFNAQFNHAKKVIFLDGFVTQITTGLLDDLQVKPYIAGSAVPPPRRKMILCDSEAYIYDQIEKKLANGEKIFVATGPKGKKKVDTKGSVEHVASTILKQHPTWKRGVEVLVFHGDTKKAKDDLAAGAVNVLGNPRVRLVIGNAALAVGIDFSPSEEQLASGRITQFDSVVGMLQPSCISFRDFFQLLYRVRQLKSDTFTVYLGKPYSQGRKRGLGVKRALPDCAAYNNLVKRIETELRATNSLSYKQMFKKFCEWMNIEIIEGVECLTEEEQRAVESRFDYSLSMFAWNNINDITEQLYEWYVDQLKESEMSAEMFLEMEKHTFKKLVPPEKQEEEWNQNKNIVYAMTSLMRHEDNLDNSRFRPVVQTKMIYDFYKANNLSYGDAIPLNAVCTTPYKDIQKAFGFHNVPTTYGMHLYSKLLNIFFESSISRQRLQKVCKRQTLRVGDHGERFD